MFQLRYVVGCSGAGSEVYSGAGAAPTFQFINAVVWSEISGVIVLGYFSKEYNVEDL